MKRCILILVPIFICILVSVSSAQYFGRNKVRDTFFNFKVLKTDHFDIYCYSGDNLELPDAAQMLERWHERVSQLFLFELSHQIVIIYRNRSDFAQLNIMSNLVEGLGAVREPSGQRIIVSLTGIKAEDNHVLGHEVVHAFQLQLVNRNSLPLLTQVNVPLWFLEGMAEYFSLGKSEPVTAMWMRDQALQGRMPSFYEIGHDERRYSPYRFGHAIWAWFGGEYGDSAIAPLYIAILKGGWEKGFAQVCGINADAVSQKWQSYALETFSRQAAGRKPAASLGRSFSHGANDYYLSPSQSPDGTRIGFFTVDNRFTRSIAISDLKSGRSKTLATESRGEHLNSISFIQSPGTWSPNSREFAALACHNDRSAFNIYDAKTGKISGAIVTQGMDEDFNAAWAPNGKTILISAVKNGQGRLLLYNCETQVDSVIKQGPYTTFQATWSPDGRRIVYVTDSGAETQLRKFIYGQPRIQMLTLGENAPVTITLGDNIMHLSPQFSRDGRSIFFVADPDGVYDLYRYEVASGRFFRMTRTATGISGSTAYTPPFSVDGDSIVFSTIDNGRFRFFKMSTMADAGQPYAGHDTADYATKTALRPDSGGGIVEQYLGDWKTGLVNPSGFAFDPYKLRLSLAQFGQVFIGTAGNEFGLSIGGSLVFSDVLNYDLLNITGEVDTFSLDGIGVKLGYLNQRHKWNWGFSASHIPYHTPKVYVTTVDGTQNVTLQRQRDFYDQLNFVLQQPLSINNRLEYNLTYSWQYFNNHWESFNIPGNASVPPAIAQNSAPPAVHGITATAAYIGDYSILGFTSPLIGSRYHLEAGPTLGTQNYAYVQLDYRYYWYLRPFTLAFRAMHVGEYGDELHSGQLPVLYLGFPTWVRGYTTRSFDFSKALNDTGPGSDTHVYNTLSGSKVAIGNVELRLPLVGSQQFGLVDFMYLPTDFLVFLDGGLAWVNNQGVSLALRSGSKDRIPVFGTGVGLRFGILGLAAFQLYFVYPIQRPHDRPFFDYEFSTGW